MWGLNIKGKPMTRLEVTAILAGFCGDVTPRDTNYILPDDPEYILKMSPSRKFKYSKHDGRDCDDAVRIMRGWLSRKKYGNVLAMDTTIWHPDVGKHGCISFIVNKKLVLGEPQTGEFDVYKNAVIKRIIL